MDLTFIPNRLAWLGIFLVFVIYLFSRLPNGVAYSNEIILAFYSAGVYLQKANLFFPVSAMLQVLILGLTIFTVILTIKLVFFVLNLVRSNGGNM